MAKDLNRVQLTGHLGADPEMRYTAQGSAVTTFRVASNRTWRDKDGNPHEETEWFRVVAWDKLAELCNQYLAKGSRVYVEGRIQTRKWTDPDGRERYTTEIIAQDIIFLSTPKHNGIVDDYDGDIGDIGDDGAIGAIDGSGELRGLQYQAPPMGRNQTPPMGRNQTPPMGRNQTPPMDPSYLRTSTPSTPSTQRQQQPPKPPVSSRKSPPPSMDDDDIPF